MNFDALNTVIATLFIIMVVGFICRKVGIIDDAASKKLSALILKIGQPAMIINSLASAKYTEENLQVAGIVVVLGFILHAIFAILAYFMCLPLKKNLDERKITEYSLVFNNCAFIGFPIFQALFPENGLFMAAFLIISFNVLIWTWGLSIFARGRDDIKLTVKKVLFNYGTVPCAIGFILFMLKNPAIQFDLFGTQIQGFTLPEFMLNGLQYLHNLCTPISLLITGALIATQTKKQLFGKWQIYYFNVMKLFVIPVIVCLICKLIGLPYIYAMFATAAAALPAASSVSMFSEMYGLDSGYSSVTVGTSSLLSVISLPLTLMLSDIILKL